jgi:hypothetical protein
MAIDPNREGGPEAGPEDRFVDVVLGEDGRPVPAGRSILELAELAEEADARDGAQ